MFLSVLFTTLIAVGLTSAANIPYLDGRIYNGFETTVEEFPHQVQLVRGTSHHCGATIVGRPGSTHSYVAITAAHCIAGAEPRPFRINAGITNRTEVGQLAQVKSIIVHPDFDFSNFQGDIAVLVLETPITFNDKVQPAYLPDYNEKVAPNTKAFASGWGITENRTFSDTLRAVELNVLSSEKCADIFGPKRYTDKNLCAASADGKQRDSCGGDSGGPLFSNGKLIGVVSWGYGCGNPEYPGVYANVENLRQWIDSVVTL